MPPRPDLQSALGFLCMLLGTAGLAFCLVAYADAWMGSRQAVAEVADGSAWAAAAPAAEPERGAPLGLLRIARLSLEVPVLYGTDPLTLNRGAGIVAGSDLPGARGHVVISAHRDSYFRPLKDIRAGDVIELHSAVQVQRFSVARTFITDALDVSVLEEPEGSVLTLITCYPFHYVGFAPDRFIVKAVLEPRTAG